MPQKHHLCASLAIADLDHLAFVPTGCCPIASIWVGGQGLEGAFAGSIDSQLTASLLGFLAVPCCRR